VIKGHLARGDIVDDQYTTLLGPGMKRHFCMTQDLLCVREKLIMVYISYGIVYSIAWVRPDNLHVTSLLGLRLVTPAA
jgi:hypothetical protein